MKSNKTIQTKKTLLFMNNGIVLEPPDLLEIYTSDIKYCQTLNRSQETWLGIFLAAENKCKELFGGVSKEKYEIEFIRLQNDIKSIAESLDRNVFRIDGETIKIESLMLHLINEIIYAQKGILFWDKSLLGDLVDQLQSSIHKYVLDLVIQLSLLPIETLRTYLLEIERNIELPSARKLIKSYNSLVFQKNINAIERRANHARDLLIKSQIGYVKWFAYRYRNFGLEYLDIIQEGNIGLIIAASRFDVYKNNSFKTFALWWIRQSIQRAIANYSRTIRLPVHRFDEVRILEREYISYQKKYDDDPPIEYLSDKCGIGIKNVKRSLELLKPILSLEELEACEINIQRSIDNKSRSFKVPICLNCEFFTNYPYFNRSLMVPQRKEIFLCQTKNHIFSYKNGQSYFEELSEMLKDYTLKDLDDSIFYDQLKSTLKKILYRFSDRDQEILYMRYGLKGDEPKTLEEVGENFELTRERIRQIEKKIFKTFKKPTAVKILKSFLLCFG